jgi:hypothetical protein
MLCGFVYVKVCISLHDFYLFSVSLSISPVWKYLFVCREVRMIAYRIRKREEGGTKDKGSGDRFCVQKVKQNKTGTITK